MLLAKNNEIPLFVIPNITQGRGFNMAVSTVEAFIYSNSLVTKVPAKSLFMIVDCTYGSTCRRSPFTYALKDGQEITRPKL
jgi:hypothetical protein